MKFSDAAELICLQWLHLPCFREDFKQRALSHSCGLLDHALEPSKSTFGVLEGSVGLAWREQFLVGIEHVGAEPNSQVIHCLFTNGIQCCTCFKKFVAKCALLNCVEVFQNLQPQLVAKSFLFLLDLSNLRCRLYVVSEV